MGLDYAYEFSAQLVKYNFIYGLFSTNTPVLDSLFCDYHFIWILDDFGIVLNMKVVYNLLKYLLIKFHEFLNVGL